MGGVLSLIAGLPLRVQLAEQLLLPAMQPTGFSNARRIRPGERDYDLELEADRWPKNVQCPDGWEAHRGGTLRRRIAAGGQLACEMEEAMLRFPAAPVHGLQRLHEGHARAGKALNFHSYRILTGTNFKRPVKRMFLLHNGLNELTRMGLYYELAAHLIAEEPVGTACVLRPFPGHLTRFPYHAFGEQPLDAYLWDGSHLFRQFMRHMVETQWFLSACVRRSEYRNLAGANLLAEHRLPDCSRLDDTCLARAMANAWGALYDSSERTLDKPLEGQRDTPGMMSKPNGIEPFRQSIKALRLYLGLKGRLDGEVHPEDSEPDIHVLGYSLGGFAAQSVFMSWPCVVDSCSTLLSGGPLRDLAPTAFADPEEWQTVLHSLRYELDELLSMGRFDRDDKDSDGSESEDPESEFHIAGMDRDLFLYFQRTFYEVFQQEYHGSFQSRLSEFRPRMLFVVGGDDPIVRPQSVLDSGPPGGINLFEIAGLGHFLASEPSNKEERAQREFWLPEIGKLITRFADNAATIKLESREDTWLDENGNLSDMHVKNDGQDVLKPLAEAERGLTNGALPAQLFGRHLDDLLARVRADPRGYLVILRNEVPSIMLNAHGIQRRARALHHDDARIAAYSQGVARRWRFIDTDPGRICVVLPWNAQLILKYLDAGHGFPSQSETAVGQVQDKRRVSQEWEACDARCTKLMSACGDTVRVFDGRVPLRVGTEDPDLAALVKAGLGTINRKDESITQEATLRVSSMPDCWIWFSHESLSPGRYEETQKTPADVRRRITELVVASQANDEELSQAIARDNLRMITVSRARFNPRFRGRLLTELDLVKPLLLHSALCLIAAQPWQEGIWVEEGELPRRRITGGDSAPEREAAIEAVHSS
jgi:hypothetical protein